MGLIYFLLLLGGLVFFHEFGHFIVARMCGVKVLTFSLGFGPGWSPLLYFAKQSVPVTPEKHIESKWGRKQSLSESLQLRRGAPS